MNETKKSLLSLIPSVKTSKHSVNVYIGDNNSPPEMVEWLLSLKSDKITVYLSEKNVGKSTIVNYMCSLHNNCDYVISCDSDLIYEGTANWVDEAVWCMNNFPRFKLLSLNQFGNCQHLSGLFSTTRVGKHIVKFGNYRSIAGGCFIIKRDIWDKIGGYKDVGVYGADDANVMLDVSKIASLGVIETLGMYHPFPNNEGYEKWKKENITKYNEKGFFDV
jgi:GT2 family glycosyltransferase